jgi:hypothetical protein
MQRIAAAYPNLNLRTSPISLREIFIAQARESARAEARGDTR